MAATTTKKTKRVTVTVTLPLEIITEEIFPKASLKSLLSFKFTSKSFKTLISSQKFIDKHLRLSLSSNANRLLLFTGEGNTNLYSINADSPQTSIVEKIPLPQTLNDWLSGKSFVVGSCNGLICVGLQLDKQSTSSRIYKHVIINPITREYREIPYVQPPYFEPGEEQQQVRFGFGYDDIHEDYKVMMISENSTRYCPYPVNEMSLREIMVYSLNNDRWKLVERIYGPNLSMKFGHPFIVGALMNNYMLHWLFWYSHTYFIRCFDLRTETWVVDVPMMELFTYQLGDFEEDLKDKVVNVLHLGVIDGCLCLQTSTTLSYVVWMMKEYGVVESWVKLFEIPCRFGFARAPLGFRHGSSKREVFARDWYKDEAPIFWCDIESESFDRTEIKGMPFYDVAACFFKGSLVKIPGGQPIKAAAGYQHGNRI